MRRYLPAEIAATVGEFGGAALSYAITGSFVAAAVAGTVGASVGYYWVSFHRAIVAYYRTDLVRTGLRRRVFAVLLALRSLTLEFGPAEVIDSFGVRPLSWYVGLSVIGNTLAGWLTAKLVADVGFYACAIASYEINKTRLAPTPGPATSRERDGTAAATQAG
ncbi:hypothetical protein GCM10007304_18570 [Rhodococcoides trifolii]|uniref:Uncharacterized protein n=1 Tax=Rhodococcoides trifolii TaxID=908250 RepID=A0A917FTX8_9NOCA|nr:hypothetical protein GCM10007304_18570 [Rhodococcus trifolii]